MQDRQQQLAHLLFETKAFCLGDFVLKSGSKSPYFVDFGRISEGRHLVDLGRLFATALMEDVGADKFDLIVGPAYKGIPIGVATATALQSEFGVNKRFCYNRKESKQHGADKNKPWVGAEPQPGDRVLLIDDVFTTGATKLDIIEQLRHQQEGLEVVALVVGVDRKQHAKLGGECLQEFCTQAGIKGVALIDVDNLVRLLTLTEAISKQAAEGVHHYVRTGEVRQ